MPIYTVFVIQLSKYRRNIQAIVETKNEQKLLIEEVALCDDYDCEVNFEEEDAAEDQSSKKKLHLGGVRSKLMKNNEISSSLMSPDLSIHSNKPGEGSVIQHSSIIDEIGDSTYKDPK